MKIIIAFLAALLVFLVMKAFHLLLKRLFYRFPGLGFLANVVVAMEFVVWLAYAFWVTYYLFREKFFYHYLFYALILIVAVLLGWFLLRDIFAGIVFKVKYNLKTGTHIRAGSYSGNIKSQHLTHLKIKTDDGQMIRIPFSRINHEVVTELSHPEALQEHKLRLRVDSSISKAQAENLIRTAVLNTAWSNPKEEPSIKFLQENEKGYVIEVMFFSMSTRHVQYIEIALKEVPSIQVI